MRLSVECAFPYLRKRGVTSRKSAFSNRHLTEKRILQPAPHGKAHSAAGASRKSALCSRDATEKRILTRHLTEKRILTVREIAECVFP